MNASISAVTAAVSLAFGGCMTVAVDPDGALGGVSSLVRERSGHEIGRATDPAAAGGVDERVRTLLDDGLGADDAVQIALLHNREIQATYADLGVAQSDLVQASLLHNPVMDVAAGFPLGGGVADLSFGFAMDVVDLLYVPLRKRVAAAELEETKLRVTGGVLDLAARTRATFYRHQANEQKLEIRRRVAEATAASAEFARRMRAAGNLTELERATEAALAEEARLDLRAAELEVRESRESLNVLLGLWGPEAAWTVASTRLPNPSGEPDLSGLERRAVERSLDLAMAAQRVVAAGEQLGLTRASALFPEILVGGEGAREGAWEAGPSLSLPVPLFDWGQARSARARHELRRARELRHALGVTVRSVARATRDRLRGHRERALYYRDVLLPLRERIVHETQLQLNAMQVTPFDLLRAKERQIEAGIGYVDSLRDFWLAQGDLDLLLAGRLPGAGADALRGAEIDSPRRSPIPTLN